jgi:hypothetical protein
MKATVKVKSQVLEVTKFIKWENDHAKYEGCLYMVSAKGVEYMGFVLKGSNKVLVNYCGTFSTRTYGMGEVHGLEFSPYPSENDVFEKALAEKFGIGAKVAITNEGITIDIETIQSAQTLLKAFRRHQPLIKANDYMNYTMFIPNINPQTLLI